MKFREMIKNSCVVRDFYKEHPPEYNSEFAGRVDGAIYFGVLKNGELIAVTSYVPLNSNVANMQSTVVHPKHRGKGVGTWLNHRMEIQLIKEGFSKVTSNVYIENIPSIVLKLKLDYVIEGLLRDHDSIGQHEYVLGKILGE